MFFSFDGLDGVGKTTQIERFVEWLRAQRHDVVTCQDPGSTPLGEEIRAFSWYQVPSRCKCSIHGPGSTGRSNGPARSKEDRYFDHICWPTSSIKAMPAGWTWNRFAHWPGGHSGHHARPVFVPTCAGSSAVHIAPSRAWKAGDEYQGAQSGPGRSCRISPRRDRCGARTWTPCRPTFRRQPCRWRNAERLQFFYFSRTVKDNNACNE
jgi:hypothetical protein